MGAQDSARLARQQSTAASRDLGRSLGVASGWVGNRPDCSQQSSV